MKLKHWYDAPPVGLGDDSEMEGGREGVKGERDGTDRYVPRARSQFTPAGQVVPPLNP